MEISVLANRIHDLPTLPLVAHQINIESQSDTFTAHTLGVIIERDPPLTSKVLRLANSAYYGFARQVASIDRAVVLLGANTIKNLALTVSVLKVFSEQEMPAVDLDGLWQHCIGCAVAAKAIARIMDLSLAENAFLGGIIHDIGKIVLINMFPDKMQEVLRRMDASNVSQSEAEKTVFGFNHQAAGVILAEKWNFPKIYSEIIRLHHTPPLKKLSVGDRDAVLHAVVFAGNQLAKTMGLGKSLDPRAAGVPPELWDTFGVSAKMLPELHSAIKEEFQEMISSWE